MSFFSQHGGSCCKQKIYSTHKVNNKTYSGNNFYLFRCILPHSTLVMLLHLMRFIFSRYWIVLLLCLSYRGNIYTRFKCYKEEIHLTKLITRLFQVITFTYLHAYYHTLLVRLLHFEFILLRYLLDCFVVVWSYRGNIYIQDLNVINRRYKAKLITRLIQVITFMYSHVYYHTLVMLLHCFIFSRYWIRLLLYLKLLRYIQDLNVINRRYI